jgi:hypothetical protein
MLKELRSLMFPNFDFAETRASSFGNGAETAEMLTKAKMVDVRKLGCPDDIFEFVLEQRSARAEQRGSDVHVPDNHREAMSLRMEQALRS